MDVLAGADWQLAGTAPGAVGGPADLDTACLDWIAAAVPGTVAGALRSAHGEEAALDADIDGRDWWWRTTVTASGALLLVADGVATVWDVWVDGVPVLHGESMLRTHTAEVSAGAGTAVEVVLRCSAPLAGLGRRARPRWRSTLVPEQRWRWLRTVALGRIPTWHGAPAPAGPWRALRLHTLDTVFVARQRVAARLDGADGVLDVELDVRGAWSSLAVRVAGQDVPLTPDHGDGPTVRGSVRIPDVEPWWPHSHGAQPRYPLELVVDGDSRPLTDVAFRTVTADTTDGSFALAVNGVPVFARGACWTPLDPVDLQATPAELRAALGRARDGGHNLVRVPGTTGYEVDAFYAACDELGLLVWQDCALVTLDPPDTPEFAAELRAEVSELADRLAGRACVAVVCGGAETEQQPAMLGLPATPLPALTEIIPAVLAQHLPGVPYVTSTPSGGGLPIHAGTGIAQYFGVGAYLRPLLDVRAAGVRFAGECLAVSCPPEQHAVLAEFGTARVAGHDPRWKRTVPRDPSGSWDFEDVRDHYVREIFGVDPMHVRYADPERYLDLGRAAVCIVMQEVFGWWRRPRSGCGGGVVLSARDLTPGAGWGLIDAHGRAKASWFALRQVLTPLALLIGDDGADGMTVTAVSDGPQPVTGTLELRTWSGSGALVDHAGVPMTVGAHASTEVSLDAALGRFTDAGHYYRFGPRARDLLQARVVAPDGAVLAEHTAELGHHQRPLRESGLSATVRRAGAGDDGGWVLDVCAERPAHWVAIDSTGHEPADSWFHLAPGEHRLVALEPVAGDASAAPPQVTVRALDVVEFTALVTTGQDG